MRDMLSVSVWSVSLNDQWEVDFPFSFYIKISFLSRYFLTQFTDCKCRKTRCDVAWLMWCR